MTDADDFSNSELASDLSRRELGGDLSEIFEDGVLNTWTYYELIREDDELYIVETIMTQFEDQVPAQADSETYQYPIEELDDEEAVAALRELGRELEEGESVDVRHIVLSHEYEEEFDDDFDEDFTDNADDDATEPADDDDNDEDGYYDDF